MYLSQHCKHCIVVGILLILQSSSCWIVHCSTVNLTPFEDPVDPHLKSWCVTRFSFESRPEIIETIVASLFVSWLVADDVWRSVTIWEQIRDINFDSLSRLWGLELQDFPTLTVTRDRETGSSRIVSSLSQS